MKGIEPLPLDYESNELPLFDTIILEVKGIEPLPLDYESNELPLFDTIIFNITYKYNKSIYYIF